MTQIELLSLIENVKTTKTETQTLEIKAASQGCPKRLYDSISAFSNQDDGGVILFGIDEEGGFVEVGVYDSQNLITHIKEQCDQMEPPVRAVFTMIENNQKQFVCAEIPGLDVSERPCFYKGKGRLKGSYIRIGVIDEPMTEYEVYSYEAFRRKYQDDVRPVERATMASLDQTLLEDYLLLLKRGKPHLAQMDRAQIVELMSITRNGIPTVASVLLFCPYPQAYFPQLCITAVSVPGDAVGDVGESGERFLDNKRIEGNLLAMLEGALSFVRTNTRTKTIINPDTGKRADSSDYPMTAVREAVLNALIHRDYSVHTEGMPIQLHIYPDRFEIRSPGGLYGRIRVDQLGKVQPDTRNPVLAVALELLRETENRYSGIPTMRRELAKANMPKPEFGDERGSFVVRFWQKTPFHQMVFKEYIQNIGEGPRKLTEQQLGLLKFCQTPRSRKEMAEFLGLGSVSYATNKYIIPLVEGGVLRMTLPDKKKSTLQQFVTVHK